MNRPQPEHGDIRRYRQGCPCRPCKDAGAKQGREYRRAVAYGRNNPDPLIDATPARERIAELRGSGLGMRRIAELSGLTRYTLHAIVAGQPQVTTRTLQALLGTPPRLAPTALVDATGSRRRLQALVADGVPVATIADRADAWENRIRRILTGAQPNITAAKAALIDTAYEELRCPLHPSRRAMNYAARKGWVCSTAWDDVDIDDPAAKPAGHRAAVRAAAFYTNRADEARRLTDTGLTDQQVADTLGIKLASLRRLRQRNEATA